MAPHSSTFVWKIPWMEEPGRLQSMGLLESDMTERLHFHFSLSCIGEGNGNPLQYSCLENPMVHGVTKSRTGLKELGTLAPQSFTICVFPPRSSTWTPWNLLIISKKLLNIPLWSLFPLYLSPKHGTSLPAIHYWGWNFSSMPDS